MREDPNHIAEIAHTTPKRSSIYDNDYATVEQIAVDVAELRERLVRWSVRLIYEPPSIGDAIMHIEAAQNDLATALSSIENARDGG